MWIFIAVIIGAVVAAVIIAAAKKKTVFVSGARRAGIRGEKAVKEAIESILRKGDYLFANVEVSFDGRPAEMDNVIVNSCGVFIIEVKNWKGTLYGSEEDIEWVKIKDDGYGNTFEKTEKNPVKQVKRQVYILSRFLECSGCRVWVEGYVLFIHGNGPARSDRILTGTDDIDRVIHTQGRTCLSGRQVKAIAGLLK